jgi:hypothetical protein
MPLIQSYGTSGRETNKKSYRKRVCVDRKPAFWNSGYVKTTLDLPDDLMRAVKIRAVHEEKKLKDAIAEFIRKGMAAGRTRPLKTPKPVKLRGGPITTEEIEAAIAWGRD